MTKAINFLKRNYSVIREKYLLNKETRNFNSLKKKIINLMGNEFSKFTKDLRDADSTNDPVEIVFEHQNISSGTVDGI